jgi:hypothetical protein
MTHQESLLLVDHVMRLREGGHVTRAHTCPRHGDYTVASHSWQAAVLLLALNPKASKRLLTAVIMHDAQERFTGDFPRHAGTEYPALKHANCNAEYDAQIRLGIDPPADLPAEEHLWFSAIDGLEFLLWCDDQIALGNQHVARFKENQWKWFENNKLPKPIREFLRRYQWKRCSDTLPKGDK